MSLITSSQIRGLSALLRANPVIAGLQEDIQNLIMESCSEHTSSNEDSELVKILAPLTDNPNAPDEDGNTPIHLAAQRENARIVKILASLTDNPNVPNKSGKTPCSLTKNAEIRGILYSKT